MALAESFSLCKAVTDGWVPAVLPSSLLGHRDNCGGLKDTATNSSTLFLLRNGVSPFL